MTVQKKKLFDCHRLTAVLMLGALTSGASVAGQVRNTEAFFGDTHLHTSLSADAYALHNRTAGPDTAYRFAKGQPVVHPFHGAKVKINTPLDFLVVADHAEYAGVVDKLVAGDEDIMQTEIGRTFNRLFEEGKGQKVYYDLVATVNNQQPIAALNSKVLRRNVWHEITEAADRHYQPGKFTTFAGWEWSSLPDGANLHRVVFQKESGERGKQYIPYSSFDSGKPEDLWNWLDETSEKHQVSFVAIPHNSNISKGRMFSEIDSEGRPISANYARTRMRWEPIVEVTQVKGDSETHPALSPDDEFADFETYANVMDTRKGGKLKSDTDTDTDTDTDAKANYVRSGLMRGLEIESKVGANPYKFGLIGSTDSHTGLATAEESNFWGKFAVDSTPSNRKKEVLPGVTGMDMAAEGLAAVWAEENTREAIFEAFQRKEVYATTGPRIRLRFFGGWDFNTEDAYASTLARIGYRKGVPMGGDLTQAPAGRAPEFLFHAVKDPQGANLDRVQIVKGWVDAKGQAHEKIYNVALSDGRESNGGLVEPVGNTVDINTGSYSNSIGDAQLASVWSDPDFNPKQRAFYYARVLEIPTPRHTTLDAVALGEELSDNYPVVIQERAYSSPVWYTPSM